MAKRESPRRDNWGREKEGCRQGGKKEGRTDIKKEEGREREMEGI